MFKTRVVFEFLHEEDIGELTLAEIAHECDEGVFVGRFTGNRTVRVTPKRMAKLLSEFGSEPGFFQLTEDGKQEE